jgi:SAM-dependent methyltransferase
MKLSELVNFRNELNKLSPLEIEQTASAALSIITHLVTSRQVVDSNLSSTLSTRQEEIVASFKNFEFAVGEVQTAVHKLISEAEKQWFQESYRLFEAAKTCEINDHILNNRRSIPNELTIKTEEILRARLVSYGGWKYPGLIIRPGKEDFIESMVGYDPLYILDQNHELLEPCLKRFPKLYQNRLRPYVINDWSDDPLLGKIPNGQFGVCLAYNVFNFRPLEILRRYFTEIYQKLRPGGVLLMTFNDCDNEKAVMLVEQNCASYTPGYLVRDLAKTIGFDLVNSWGDGGPGVWLELKKPGTLSSLRGGQVIAKIGNITDFQFDIDFDRHRVYTSDEIENLRIQAQNLEVPEDVIESSTPFELQLTIQGIQKELQAEQERKREEIRLENRKLKAVQYNIDPEDPQCDNLIHLAERRKVAQENNIDISFENWEQLLDQVLKEKELARRQQEEEDRKLAIELEYKRVAALHEWAWEHGVDPVMCPNEAEIHRQVAEAIDQGKREILMKLRQQALELGVGNPSLVRYGYSAEKLQQLINEKEKETK